LPKLDAVIMMTKSALEVIKEIILVRDRRKEDMTTSQKQRRSGGNAAANTVTDAMSHITYIKVLNKTTYSTKKQKEKTHWSQQREE
jgi:hypothetical protein